LLRQRKTLCTGFRNIGKDVFPEVFLTYSGVSGRDQPTRSSLTILRDYNEVSEKKKGLAEIEIE